MIRITRKAKPKVLQKNESLWTNAIRLAINNKDKAALEIAVDKYKHKEIKAELSAMLHGKCAFCESYIENVDYGHIEHFKPKSKFPLQAVIWDNLLLSCAKCNGAGRKGDNWPTKSKNGPLINPCDEDPNTFFKFLFDEITQTTIVKPKNARGNTSEIIYGLNKFSLLKDRNIKVRTLVALAQYYHTDVKAKKLLDEATKDDGEYAAFARMVKRKYT